MIETIFDHGATMAELDALFGKGDFDSQAEYMEFREEDQQSALAHIVWLARLRGDEALRRATLKRVADPVLRRDLSLTPCLEAGRRLATETASRESRQAA